MLSKFGNEVLSGGPEAVLPQNLNHVWLKKLQKMAEDFLEFNYDLGECKTPQHIADPILSVCVSEILQSRPKGSADIPGNEMLKKITIYSLSLIMEAVKRESDFDIEQPTLENIFSEDRIAKIKTINPEFIKTLEQACIIQIPSNSDSKK